MTIQGNFTGTAALTVTSGTAIGVGTLIFSGDNSGFSGDIVLDGGALAIGSATACGDRCAHLG